MGPACRGTLQDSDEGQPHLVGAGAEVDVDEVHSGRLHAHARLAFAREAGIVLPKLELASQPELVSGSLHLGGIKRMMVRASA